MSKNCCKWAFLRKLAKSNLGQTSSVLLQLQNDISEWWSEEQGLSDKLGQISVATTFKFVRLYMVNFEIVATLICPSLSERPCSSDLLSLCHFIIVAGLMKLALGYILQVSLKMPTCGNFSTFQNQTSPISLSVASLLLFSQKWIIHVSLEDSKGY